MKRPGRHTSREEKFLQEMQRRNPAADRRLLEIMMATRQLVDLYIRNGWIDDAKRIEQRHLAQEMWLTNRPEVMEGR